MTAVLIPSTSLDNNVTYYRLVVSDHTYPCSPPGTLRRYSEILAFHNHLLTQFPTELSCLQSTPDLRFPTKSLGSAFRKNNTSVVAARQRDLATYLTLLIQTPPFRSSALLLDLLNVSTLPDTKATGYDWIHNFQSYQSNLVDIRQEIVHSQQQLKLESKNSQMFHHYIQVSRNLEARLNALLTQLDDLDLALSRSKKPPIRYSQSTSNSSHSSSSTDEDDHARSTLAPSTTEISSKERIRRRNLLLSLRQQVTQVHRQLKDQMSHYTECSTSPSDQVVSNRVLGGGHSMQPRASLETLPSAPPNYTSPSQVLAYQKAQISNQDQIVDSIGSIVHRLKNLGHVMHDELATQHQMLDDTQAHMDRVGARVRPLNRQIKKV